MSLQPTFTQSADARWIYHALMGVKVGETLVYEAISAAIGKSARDARSAIRAARHAALRDNQAVFACVKNIGYKRLADVEIVKLGGAETASTRRRAKRTAAKLTAVENFSALPNATQLRHTALLSVNLMIASAAQEKSIGKVEKASQGRASQLPIADTLRAMGLT